MKQLAYFLLILSLALTSHNIFAKNNKDKGLPPGLEKKAERGQDLPPGWKKKLRKGYIIEPEIFNHATIISPVNALGEVKIKIQDELLKIHKETKKIIEILPKPPLP